MGEARSAAAQETEIGAAKACLECPAAAGPSMESVVERDNMRRALEQVRRNKGAPGIDGMTVDDLVSHLKEHWPAIRVQLLNGTYRRVEIPKATGGKRALGIPTHQA
jgi:RNA-directed DNA polymerase